MSDPRRLMQVDNKLRPFWIVGDRSEIGTVATGWAEAGLTVRVVRGRKMRTVEGLFDEFASALQFPLYFGENEDAFDECISELENLPRGEGFVVIVTEPDQVLADAGGAALEWLAQSLGSATEEWSRPVELGEWWDRPAVPFHVVLAGQQDEITLAGATWSTAGCEPTPLA
ncbi:barstar family protein [Nocardioides sp. TRM66260-LWL]|uniref:barstar family protein n=1 Tax=Nocardioides sp. TRM66260-LWL TaxID=2874478 RepID=UPI001CC5D49F|nr:barstar family protein [Nocardioides sp. TRM66260-LWL]MBZ5733303.1 barstar family protein [Nocardioides sp. TRM66260-LWL]